MPLHRTPVLICLLFAWLPLLASTGGEAFKPPLFDHYQPILDRMPFGALPDNFNLNPQDATASQLEAKTKAEQELLKKKIKMSVVNITPAGATAIGFTDLSVKPPVNHYLKVGESSAGWLVVSADYGTGSAVIEKDGVSVELSLQQAAAAPAVANAEKGKPQEEKRNEKFSRRGSSGSLRHSFARGVLPGVNAPGQLIPSKTDSVAASTPSSGQDKPATVSYADRLRARHTMKTREQLAAEAKMREQFEKLARDTAAKEIQRREEEALLAAQAEAELAQPQLEAQQPTEAPLPAPEPDPPPAALQEGNTE